MRQLATCLSVSVLALLLGAPDAPAQNRQMELEWLRLAGATYGGQAATEETGGAVARVGDVNDDGFDDFVVGTWKADVGTKFDAGRVYLVYGGLGLTGAKSLVGAGAIFNGEKEDWHAGQAVAGVGDVNGDGFDDFMIGSPGAKTNNQTSSGRVYLVYGSATLGGTIDLTTYTGGVVINGASEFDLAGTSLAGPGDVNGDTYPDLVIGASGADNGAALFAGAAYIVYGGPALLPPAGSILQLSGLTSTTGVVLSGTQGSPTAESFGDVVGAAGDVNGDGLRDVLIGARLSDAQSPTKVDSGRAWIVYGSASLPGTIANNTITTLGLGVTLNGQVGGDNFATRVEGAGDVNGDGYDDVLASAPVADPVPVTGIDAGRTYLIYGGLALPGTIATGDVGTSQPGIVFTGIDGTMANPSGDRSGNALGAGGDFNRDGYDDLLIAAASADANGDNTSGEVYLIEGGPALPSSIPLSAIHAHGVVLAGVDTMDTAGTSTGFAGDINGDGFTDVLIGAPRGDPAGGADAGETVLVYGTCHMIQAVGPVAEGGNLVLRAHGTPGVANLTFASAFAILPPLQPIGTPFGPWFLASQLDLISWSFAANGEMLFSLPMPAPGQIPGLPGLTVYMQTLGQPQGNQSDLTYLLGFTVQ